MFKDVAEDRDRDFGGEVIPAQSREPLADVIGYGQLVDNRVFAEQTPVVSRDFQLVVALVDGAEQALEIVPDGARVVRVARDEGVFQRVVWQQAGVFGKGDEQHSIEDLLREGDRIERRNRGIGLLDSTQELEAQVLVILIQAVGDVFVFAAAFFQHISRAARQQVFC